MSWSKLLFIWNFEETTDRKAGFLLYPLVYFCQGHVRYMLPIENNLLLYDALLLNGHPLLAVRFLVIFCCCVLLAGDVRFLCRPTQLAVLFTRRSPGGAIHVRDGRCRNAILLHSARRSKWATDKSMRAVNEPICLYAKKCRRMS